MGNDKTQKDLGSENEDSSSDKNTGEKGGQASRDANAQSEYTSREDQDQSVSDKGFDSMKDQDQEIAEDSDKAPRGEDLNQ